MSIVIQTVDLFNGELVSSHKCPSAKQYQVLVQANSSDYHLVTNLVKAKMVFRSLINDQILSK